MLREQSFEFEYETEKAGERPSLDLLSVARNLSQCLHSFFVKLEPTVD